MEFNKANDHKSVLKAYNLLLYFAGSMVMYEPTEECVVDFWSKGILKALPVKSSNARFLEAAAQLRQSCNDEKLCRVMLMKDYNRLLAAGGQYLAPPVQSNYIDVVLHKVSSKEKVGDFYDSYGWIKRSKYKTADDNLGIELLFLTLLIDKYISLDDSACQTEMKMEIRRFLKFHVLSWIPYWNALMQEHASTMCYKGIATLIFASCEDIFNLFEEALPELNFPSVFKN